MNLILIFAVSLLLAGGAPSVYAFKPEIPAAGESRKRQREEETPKAKPDVEMKEVNEESTEYFKREVHQLLTLMMRSNPAAVIVAQREYEKRLKSDQDDISAKYIEAQKLLASHQFDDGKKIIKNLADRGHAESIYQYTILTRQVRVPEKLIERRHFLHLAHRAGYLEATKQYLKYLQEGIGGPIDLPQAAQVVYSVFPKNPELLLGFVERNAKSVAQIFTKEQLQVIRKELDQNPTLQNSLSRFYFVSKGWGNSSDEDLAIEIYKNYEPYDSSGHTLNKIFLSFEGENSPEQNGFLAHILAWTIIRNRQYKVEEMSYFSIWQHQRKLHNAEFSFSHKDMREYFLKLGQTSDKDSIKLLSAFLIAKDDRAVGKDTGEAREILKRIPDVTEGNIQWYLKAWTTHSFQKLF